MIQLIAFPPACGVAMRLFSLLLPALLCVAAANVPAAPAPITLLTEDWPPFNYSEAGQITGFSVEIVQAIMKELGVNYPFTVLPGPRAMVIFNSSPRTMFFSMIRTTERESRYKWIGPFGDQSIYFFKKKDSPLQIRTLDDARQVGKVCTRNVGLVFNYLTAAGFTNLDVGVNPAGIYLKAVNDRCDLAIGESALGVAYWLKRSNLPPDVLEQTSVKIIESPLFIAASKDISDKEIAAWQKALDKLKKSGEYAKMYQKYLK